MKSIKITDLSISLSPNPIKRTFPPVCPKSSEIPEKTKCLVESTIKIPNIEKQSVNIKIRQGGF